MVKEEGYTVEQGFRQCRRILGGITAKFIHPDSVDDMLQEFFYIALTKQGLFKTRKHFLSYAAVCIRNMCISMIRFQKKYKVIDTAIFNPNWFPSSEEAGVAFEREEGIRGSVGELMAIEEAMDKLTPRGKEIMRFTFSGLMPAEIADKLHTSVQTVKNQKATASGIIRKYISEKREELRALIDKRRIVREIEIDRRVLAIMKGDAVDVE